MFTIGRVVIAGFSLLFFLWSLAGLFTAGEVTLIDQLATQNGNHAVVKESKDNAAIVETEKVASPSVVVRKERQDPQVVLGKADTPVLDATHPSPISDFEKIQPERNRKSEPGAKPVTSAAIENQPVPIKTGKQVREMVPRKAMASVESNIPEKKPLSGRLRLERMSLKPTSGATLVLHANRQIENHTFFQLEGPARMVVDLPGKWSLSKKIPLLLAVDADLVEKIRLGQDPENLRIVFDLGSIPVNEPLFESKGNSLEIKLVAQ